MVMSERLTKKIRKELRKATATEIEAFVVFFNVLVRQPIRARLPYIFRILFGRKIKTASKG